MKVKRKLYALIIALSLVPIPSNEPVNVKGDYIEKVECTSNTFRGSEMKLLHKEYKSKWLKEKRLKKAEKRRERQNKNKVSDSDVYLLGKLIYCEVGNIKDDRCLELCGSVVLNRIKDKRYPNTLSGVIFQKGQYEVTWNGHWNYKEPDKRCLRIARKLLKYGSVQKDVNAMSERVWGKYYCRFNNVIFSIC